MPLLRRSAEAGDPDAKTTLGGVYEDGLLGKSDKKRAIAFYVEGAKGGSELAVTRLKQLGIPVPAVKSAAANRKEVAKSALNPENWGDLGL